MDTIKSIYTWFTVYEIPSDIPDDLKEQYQLLMDLRAGQPTCMEILFWRLINLVNRIKRRE
jgi:hypothetical protein